MKLQNKNKVMVATLGILASSGCGSFDGRSDAGNDVGSVSGLPATVVARADAGDPPAQVGAPYDIAGVRYTPNDPTDYDDVGYAGWVGGDRAGQITSLGEPFMPSAVSAAHKTLPIPSYVEVTALDTGRTILVRVNDRGPMDNRRLIDLSAGAADQLGIKADGVSAVRVRRVNPAESERSALRTGGRVPERLPTPEALLSVLRNKASSLRTAVLVAAVPVPAPAGAATAAPVPVDARTEAASAAPASDRFIVEGGGAAPRAAAKPAAGAKPAPSVKPGPAPKPAAAAAAGGYFVQVSAFSTETRANSVAKATGGSVAKAADVWRVRLGPFKNEAAAQKALSGVRAKGYGDARILRDK